MRQSFNDKEPFHIRQIRESCPLHLQKMQMSYEECKILYVLLKMINAAKVLELGTLVGCSTAWIDYAIYDHKDAHIISIEKSVNNYNIAIKNIIPNSRINILNDDAITILKKYVADNQFFDAIFIDAKKTEYCQYLELSKKCVRKNGIIIADNTSMNYNDAIINEMTKFSHMIENDTELIYMQIPTVSGLTVIMRI